MKVVEKLVSSAAQIKDVTPVLRALVDILSCFIIYEMYLLSLFQFVQSGDEEKKYWDSIFDRQVLFADVIFPYQL